MDDAEITTEARQEMERIADQQAKERAKSARWDLDVAAFFFLTLIAVVILVSQDIRIEIVSPIAICGLVTGWVMGWRKGKQKYEHFYKEELLKLEQEPNDKVKQALWKKWHRLEEDIKKELHER